jgi:hypothetical protein
VHPDQIELMTNIECFVAANYNIKCDQSVIQENKTDFYSTELIKTGIELQKSSNETKKYYL